MDLVSKEKNISVSSGKYRTYKAPKSIPIESVSTKDMLINMFIAYFVGAIWIYLLAEFVMKPIVCYILPFASDVHLLHLVGVENEIIHHHFAYSVVFNTLLFVQHMVISLIFVYLKYKDLLRMETEIISNPKCKTLKIQIIKLKKSLSMVIYDVYDRIFELFWGSIFGTFFLYYFNINNDDNYYHLFVFNMYTYFQIVLLLFIQEMNGYWLHRMCHYIPSLYKYHKVHHEYVETIAIASEHVDFGVDNILLKIIPSLIGNVAIYGLHLSHFGSYLLFIDFQGLLYHSGYNFMDWHYMLNFRNTLGLIATEYYNMHKYHHSHNIGTFGATAPMFWDWYCQTDKSYTHYIVSRP